MLGRSGVSPEIFYIDVIIDNDLRVSCNVVIVVSKFVKIIVECHASEMAVHKEPLSAAGHKGDYQQMTIGFEKTLIKR